jgi:hypothetical protein
MCKPAGFVLKPTPYREDPQQLAFHLISMHCDGLAIERPVTGNIDQHEYEHDGPGTIRNHPRWLRTWDAGKIEDILKELEASP